MDNIVNFPSSSGAFRPEPINPNTAIVKLLEEWTERAKRGEVTGIALAAVNPEMDKTWCWETEDPHRFQDSLIVAIDNLTFRMAEVRLETIVSS